MIETKLATKERGKPKTHQTILFLSINATDPISTFPNPRDTSDNKPLQAILATPSDIASDDVTSHDNGAYGFVLMVWHFALRESVSAWGKKWAFLRIFFFLAYSFQALCIIFSRGDFITLMGIWAISLDRNQNIMLDFRLWVGPKY